MPKFSVKKPFTVLVAVIIIMVLGIEAFTKLSTDLLPNMNLPYAVIVTTYQGANPETVEMVVTSPVESSMATLSHIKNISSQSSESYSMVILEFNQDANMDAMTIDIREKLDMLKSYWPDEVGSPMIMKLNPDMMPIMMVAVDKDGADLAAISEFVDDTLTQEMESIDGVASVTSGGLLESGIHVSISQKKIDALNKKLMIGVDNKFAEAREEIESGKEELEAGKDALDQQTKSFTQQMLDASSKITSGKIELSKNENEINSSLKDIENGERELDQKEQELQANRNKLEQNKELLLKMEAQLEEFEKQIDQAQTKLDEINEKIEALKEEPETNAAEIAVLEAEAQSLTTLITGAKEGLTALENQGISVGGTEAALKQIDAGQAVIDQTRAQLESGKAQLNSALKQIQNGQSQIVSQENQLNQAQASASAQLDDARIQIVTGQQQLDQVSKQMDEQIETAKEQADLNGVLTKDMISGILVAQNFSMPAGYVTENGTDYLVRVGHLIETEDELKQLVLFDLSDYDMGCITLSDVADFTVETNEDSQYTKINGNNGIILSMEKQNGYSTANVAKDIRAFIKQAQEKYEGLHITVLVDQGIYIDLIVESVLQNLIIGAILAILVLLLFMKDIRPTLIVAVSIPVSVIFAIVLMYFTGITMNIISLSGLALGVGMLVDNAIVVIENIYRLRAEGMSSSKAAVKGAEQVAGAILASTLTTICIWAPIVFAEGLTRQLFVELVLTIAFSLSASLIVALTVVPAASASLLKTTKDRKAPILDKIILAYRHFLKRVLRFRIVVIIGSFLLLVVTAGLVLSKGFEFMGETDSSQMTVSIKMKPGAEFEDTAAMGDEVSNRITEISDVDTVGVIMGSGLSIIGSYGNVDTQQLSYYVLLKDDRDKTSQDVAKEILEKTKDLDCDISVSSSSLDMSALGGSGISVMIKGPELEELMRISKDISSILGEIDGTIDLSDGMESTTNELRITINENKAMQHGLTVAQIFQELSKKISASTSVTNIKVNGKEIPVVVEEQKNKELTREDLKKYNLTGKNSTGEEETIVMDEIAEFEDTESLSSISRDGQQRYITVSAGVDDNHNVTLISNELEKKLEAYDMPDGYHYELSGENESIMDSLTQLVKLLALGILIMYLIMAAQFQSLVLPIIVLFTIPLAFTGGFLGLLISGNIFSIIGMVGFVMLCGIIVNNGIVFIDYTNNLTLQGMSNEEAVIEAGCTRMRPILMTAITTILAMSTMAIGLGDGTDMVQPMAIVTIGGLIYGTIMTLFVVPCIYLIIKRKNHKNNEEM